MAAKPKAKVKKAPKERAPRKEVRENPGMGHNLTDLRAKIAPFVTRFIKLSDDMASDMAGYRSDFNTLYEEGAGEGGIKKSVLTKELKRIYANKKAEEKEKEMAPDEREQTELFRAAMEGTPFGDWAAGSLATPESSEFREVDED